MTLKKILPFILIAVILTALFGPFKTNAYLCNNPVGGLPIEQDTPCPEEPGSTTYGANENLEGSCNLFNFDTINCVLSAGAVIAQYAIWTPISLFAALGGMAMDTSISQTINGSIFSGLVNEQNGVVSTGWGISRDVVNIFLIFILLYIAIATILQVSGYGAKELLATLIIIAFLVNFSSVITKMIIDASNVLTVGFYNAFPQENGQIQISKTFKDAFNFEKLIAQDSFDKIQPKPTKRDLYTIEFLTYILGAGIAAIAGFIFFVFAILFAIRMVVLLILLILAPLAFGAMILPGTKAHAKKWWTTLLHQAFFAPAALFMLYLSAKMATSSFITDIFKVNQTGLANMVADAKANAVGWDSIAKFVLQFVIIAIVLIAAIIISKQMGAMGAESAISGVTKGLRKAQGYAGRIGRYAGIRAGGPAAEKVLKGEGKAAAFVRSIPLVTRGLAGVSALEEKRKAAKAKEYEKAYGTYSEKGLEAMLKTPIITPIKRRAISAALEEKIEKREKEASKEKEITKLNELISQRKSELSRERESGVPDIQKILDIEKEIMGLENTKRGKAKKPKNLTDQLKEALKEEIKEEMKTEKTTIPIQPTPKIP